MTRVGGAMEGLGRHCIHPLRPALQAGMLQALAHLHLLGKICMKIKGSWK